MKKSILEIYALLVCFVTVCCFVICLGIGLYDIIEVTNPEFTMNATVFERFQDDETYKDNLEQLKKNLPDGGESMPKHSDEEITQKRKKGYEIELRSEKRKAVQSLVQIIIILCINTVIFILHWRIAKHAREANGT